MFNEQLTKEEYERRLAEINLSSFAQRRIIQQRCFEFIQQHPRPHAAMIKVDNVVGDYIYSSSNIKNSFFINRGGENLNYCFFLTKSSKDCMDLSLYGHGVELVYDSSIVGSNAFSILFCVACYDNVSNLIYCSYCINARDCFGCVGLKNKQYCIFNKQYSKEEYEALVPDIIAKMITDGEWGEFFPMSFSSVPYNHSFAQRYFPKTKEQIQSDGLIWYQRPITEASSATDSDDLPDELPEIDNQLVVKSSESARAYLIPQQEILKCRQFNVPLPRTTYDERMEERIGRMGHVHLYDRMCAKTGKSIKTTIPPDSDWIVWDKDVYEQEFSG